MRMSPAAAVALDQHRRETAVLDRLTDDRERLAVMAQTCVNADSRAWLEATVTDLDRVITG